MVGISLTQRMMTDPQLREAVREASSKQKIQVLKKAGFSQSDINQAAEQTTALAGNIFQGKPPCE